MKVGDRIRLIRSDDPSGIPKGEEGSVIYIGEISKSDVIGLLGTESLLGRKKFWVEWDKGGKLALIEGIDKFEIISDRKKR
jgi:hypothetical protein